MKERGIIMRAPNPTLILEDRKTQTRRIQGLEKINENPYAWSDCLSAAGQHVFRAKFNERKPPEPDEIAALRLTCPYGVAGDRLYVKETHWRFGKFIKDGRTKTGRQRWRFKIVKRLDRPFSGVSFEDWNEHSDRPQLDWHKRPSIFLPKKLARIWLEITKVRVERLQDIRSNRADLLAEGMNVSDSRSLSDEYHDLWDSLYGKGAWEKNPWVWVIEFKRL